MTLVRDVELPIAVADLARGDVDADAVRELFDFLEFRNLHVRLAGVIDGLGDDSEADQPTSNVLEAEVVVPETADEAAASIAEVIDSSQSAPIAMAIPILWPAIPLDSTSTTSMWTACMAGH